MRFLFVDRILELSPEGICRGIKHVTLDDHYLTMDDEGRPCFMPSLMGEVLGQLAAWNVMQQNAFTLRPVAGVAALARLHRPAYVGETVLLESFIDNVDEKVVEYHSVASINDEIAFTIEGALGPLLPMEDFIDKQQVKQQFKEIYRPGDWSLVQSKSFSEAIFYEKKHYPRMNFDRILAHEPGISMLAEKRITRTAPYFADHFPNKPVLPMTILLECKLNLAKEFLSAMQSSSSYRVRELRRIKMNDFIQPGDVVLSSVKAKHQEAECVLSFRSEVNGRRVCVVDVVFDKVN